MKLFPLPKEFQVLDVTLKELDTTFIINEKDHVLFLQKKITLTFTYLKLFRCIYFDGRNLKKVCILYKCIPKIHIWCHFSIYRSNQNMYLIFHHQIKKKFGSIPIFFKDDEISSDSNHFKIRAQRKRITFKKLFQFNKKLNEF